MEKLLATAFAIVILPPSEDDDTFQMVLMGLDGNGRIDWKNGESFILGRATTVERAASYAKGLAEILKINVFQLV